MKRIACKNNTKYQSDNKKISNFYFLFFSDFPFFLPFLDVLPASEESTCILDVTSGACLIHYRTPIYFMYVNKFSSFTNFKRTSIFT